MRVFLTGGTGLIGSHIAERLRRRGDTVVALVRHTSDVRHLRDLGCDLVEGDVHDTAGVLASRMRGCAAVVHAAARVFTQGRREDFIRDNVAGAERVLHAAGMSAPRVVHLSSVAVYAGLSVDGGLTEDRWLEAEPDRQAAYAASKHLSERAAWKLHDEGTIRLTTVRPSVVYGERDRAATPIIMRVCRLPVLPLPGGGRALLPLVYAGNVARGVVSALDRDHAVGRAYNLALDHPLTARELVDGVSGELGRRVRIVSVPAAPLNALAGLVAWLGRRVPFTPPTGLPRALRSVTQDNPYDSSRSRSELGWTNLTTHTEGLRRTVAWWRAGEAGR